MLPQGDKHVNCLRQKETQTPLQGMAYFYRPCIWGCGKASETQGIQIFRSNRRKLCVSGKNHHLFLCLRRMLILLNSKSGFLCAFFFSGQSSYRNILSFHVKSAFLHEVLCPWGPGRVFRNSLVHHRDWIEK